jgi:predicted neuraminidase
MKTTPVLPWRGCTRHDVACDQKAPARCWATFLVFSVLAIGAILSSCTDRFCGQFAGCGAGASGTNSASGASAAGITQPSRFVTTPIPTDNGLYPYNHAASIIELPSGDLLVAWGAGSGELADDTAIVASRRRAGETEWGSPFVVADKAGYADSNPVLFSDNVGLLWLFHVEMFGDTFCLGRVVAQTSTDEGATWSSAEAVLDATCIMVRNRPIILSTGRWVLPAYVQGIYQTQFWISDDHGGSWRSTPALLTLQNNLQPAVVELAEGGLLALMRTSGGGDFTWQGRSCDGSESWSLCRQLDLPNPDSGLDLIRLSGGQLVCVFNDSSTERSPLSASVSADEGQSWSLPRIIEGGPPQLSYPSAFQARDGTIHVVYSHRLEYIQHVEFNLSWLLDSAAKP